MCPERCNLFGLLGNFQRYGVLRLGKFPNKLWYFLAEIPPCVIGLPIEPAAGFAACTRYINYTHFAECAEHPELAVVVPALAQPKLSIYYFPLSVGGWRGGRFRLQRLLLHGAVGSKV